MVLALASYMFNLFLYILADDCEIGLIGVKTIFENIEIRPVDTSYFLEQFLYGFEGQLFGYYFDVIFSLKDQIIIAYNL